MGWVERRLQDVSLDFGRGRSRHRPRNAPSLFGGKYPFIQTGDVRGSQHFITEFSQTYNDIGLAQSKLWPAGTICVTIAANIAETGILSFDACFPDSVIGIVIDPKKTINKYVEYLLQSVQARLKAEGKGSAQDNINLSTFENEVFPFPPLPEQRRIVAILDESFAGLATMRAHAEANLKNARALFDSHLNAIFSQKGEGWVEQPISRITTKIGSGATPRGGQESYKATGIPLIRSMNVHDRRFKFDDLAFLDREQAQKLDNVIVQKDDVLLNITGASVARCCRVPEELASSRVNQHVSIIRPIQSQILSRFLEFALTAKANKERLLGVGEKGGSTRQAITKAEIEEFRLSYPTIESQKKTIELTDGLEVETNRLESLYRDKLAAIDELKQSILHRAFSGELTKEAAPAVAAPAIQPQIANDNRHATAMVLALAFERHKRAKRDKSFGHVKAQKILHMVEAEAGFDLGRNPIRDAAGPNDFPHMLAADDWAEATRHYSFTKLGEGYTFKPLAQFDALTAAARKMDPATRTRIERIIDLFIPMDMQQAEVFATVYAAWNNLLIEGKSISDEAIIHAAREDWHPNKLSIPRGEFAKALRLLKENNCTPSGKGRFVPPSPQANLFA